MPIIGHTSVQLWSSRVEPMVEHMASGGETWSRAASVSCSKDVIGSRGSGWQTGIIRMWASPAFLFYRGTDKSSYLRQIICKIAHMQCLDEINIYPKKWIPISHVWSSFWTCPFKTWRFPEMRLPLNHHHPFQQGPSILNQRNTIYFWWFPPGMGSPMWLGPSGSSGSSGSRPGAEPRLGDLLISHPLWSVLQAPQLGDIRRWGAISPNHLFSHGVDIIYWTIYILWYLYKHDNKIQ